MGRRRNRGRNIQGILLLDKPLGVTSNSALQQVKQLYNAAKAGHTGSLDPLANGLLPICFGGATKISAFLLDADKRYWLRIKLGVTTTTADAEGEVLATRPVPNISRERLIATMADFKGAIQQIPPMYSALKHKGQRLYKLAREGIEVEREPRTITIHQSNLGAYNPPEFELDIHCSKGTYVRTLAEDIGEALGCGAHVTALRRTAVGPYQNDQLVTMEKLELTAKEGLPALDRLLLPVESAVSDWPEVSLTNDSLYYIRKGQAVIVPQAPTSGWVRLKEREAGFIGVGEILEDGRVAPRRLL